MARVLGVDLPRAKRLEIGLQSIYGIGPTRARDVLEKSGIKPEVRVHELTDEQVSRITAIVQNDYKVEGACGAAVTTDIKPLVDLDCARGEGRQPSLPVRRQRTHTNASTRKGTRRTSIKKR